MLTSNLEIHWVKRFEAFLSNQGTYDSAHDPQHVRRVVENSRRLAISENARWEIVMPAAWLHDCYHVPKSSSERSQASVLSARLAAEFLRNANWREREVEGISHAIEAHSFSARIEAKTIEAKVLQDADRLDALGAVGLARTLMLGGEMRRSFYDQKDPFCDRRKPNDSIFTIDHLFSKLFTLESTMQTESGRLEAQHRTNYLREFIEQLKSEITDHR